VFLSPLSREEILFLHNEARVSLPDLVADVMRRKVLRRAQRQKDLSLKDLEEIERRAGSAYRELKEAHHFESVIPNYDGEDSDKLGGVLLSVGRCAPSVPCGRRTPARRKPHGGREVGGGLASLIRGTRR